MEQTPLEAYSYETSQEILRFVWNAMVHYRDHKTPPLNPILSPMNSVHNFPPYFPKIDSNIILPSTPSSSDWSLLFTFSDQNFLCISAAHEMLKYLC
jgi:hypothetical protein